MLGNASHLPGKEASDSSGSEAHPLDPKGGNVANVPARWIAGNFRIGSMGDLRDAIGFSTVVGTMTESGM